jgi:hypothetical protein
VHPAGRLLPTETGPGRLLHITIYLSSIFVVPVLIDVLHAIIGGLHFIGKNLIYTAMFIFDFPIRIFNFHDRNPSNRKQHTV